MSKLLIIIPDSEGKMKHLPNIHPGEILREEFLIPLNISAYRLSENTLIPQTRVSQILKGKRGITADTALRFAKFFQNSPEFWLGLQNDFDLEEGKSKIKGELESITSLGHLRAS